MELSTLLFYIILSMEKIHLFFIFSSCKGRFKLGEINLGILLYDDPKTARA